MDSSEVNLARKVLNTRGLHQIFKRFRVKSATPCCEKRPYFQKIRAFFYALLHHFGASNRHIIRKRIQYQVLHWETTQIMMASPLLVIQIQSGLFAPVQQHLG